jgi:hypothetical protein
MFSFSVNSSKHIVLESNNGLLAPRGVDVQQVFARTFSVTGSNNFLFKRNHRVDDVMLV